MCEPRPSPAESARAAGGGVLALVGVAGGVWLAVEVSSAVTVLGLALLCLLLVAGTLVTAHILASVLWPSSSERRKPAARVVSRPAMPELDEVTVHAEVVDPGPVQRRAITAAQRAVADEWAERWIHGGHR